MTVKNLFVAALAAIALGVTLGTAPASAKGGTSCCQKACCTPGAACCKPGASCCGASCCGSGCCAMTGKSAKKVAIRTDAKAKTVLASVSPRP